MEYLKVSVDDMVDREKETAYIFPVGSCIIKLDKKNHTVEIYCLEYRSGYCFDISDIVDIETNGAFHADNIIRFLADCSVDCKKRFNVGENITRFILIRDDDTKEDKGNGE